MTIIPLYKGRCGIVYVFLLIILILLLIIIAVFSLNINIIISFYASDSYDKLYKYAAHISFFLRFESGKKKSKSSLGKKISNLIFNNAEKFKPYISLHKISLVGQIAFGDAYSTAMAAGIVYSLAGTFIAFLSKYTSKIEVSRISICPVYNEKISGQFFFECILSTNAGNIIVESLKCLKGSN